MMVPVSSKLGLVALMLVVVAGCGGKSDADSMAAAKRAMGNRDNAAAAIELKSVLQRTPNLSEARYLLGVALMEQGEHSAALVELKKAQALSFSEELLAPKMARAQLLSGQFREVIRTYKGVALTTPKASAELQAAVAMAHAGLGQLQEAETVVVDAQRIDPTSTPAAVAKARIVSAKGKFDEALTLLDQVLSANNKSGEAQLLKGLILRFGKKDVDGAVRAFQEASKDPEEAVSAGIALVQIDLSRGRISEARSGVSELRKLKPKLLRVVYADAMVSFAEKDYARVDSLVEQSLRAVPNSPQFLLLGGASHLQHGNYTAAETKLGKVVLLSERMFAGRRLLAETYLRMGQPEKAMATLRPLLTPAEPDADAMMLAGQANLQLGNVGEAERLFVAASKLKPNDTQVKTALALTDLVKGNSETAFETLQGIAAQDPTDAADMALISARLRRSEFDSALIAIELLAKKSGSSRLTAAYLKGLALRGKGDLAGARGAYEAALKIDPKHYASVASLVALDLQDNKVDSARQRLEGAVKQDPNNVAARMGLLEIQERQGAQPQQVLAGIEDALRSAPQESALHVAKIAKLQKLGDVKGAALAAQNAMAAIPRDPGVLDAAGLAFSGAGDVQQAIGAFNKLAGALPRSPLPFLRLAELHAKSGDAAAVASSLSRAFEVAPESPEVHKRILANSIRIKDYKPVAAVAKDLQRRFPGSAVGYLLEGDVELSRGSRPRAVAAYKQGLGKLDAEGKSQKLVHATLVSMGNRVEADKFAADWLKTRPADAGFLAHVGGEALARKDYAAAEQYLRRVVVLQPRNAVAANNLAWVMAERGVDGAVAMAERAVSLAPTSAQILDTLAKALAGAGHLDRAIEAQKKAISASAGAPFYRLNLSKIYVKAGRVQDAIAELDALVLLGNKFMQLPEAVDLRKSLSKV